VPLIYRYVVLTPSSTITPVVLTPYLLPITLVPSSCPHPAPLHLSHVFTTPHARAIFFTLYIYNFDFFLLFCFIIKYIKNNMCYVLSSAGLSVTPSIFTLLSPSSSSEESLSNMEGRIITAGMESSNSISSRVRFFDNR